MLTTYAIIIVLSVLLFSFLGTFGLTRLLPMLSLMDHPNERSNHTQPVPRGGGIAVMFALIGFFITVGAPSPLILGLFILAVVSFCDDIHGVPVRWRLYAQTVVSIMLILNLEGTITNNLLPFWAERLLLIPLLVWFINLFNFMDGIDEITVVETCSIGGGVVLLGLALIPIPLYLQIEALILVAAMLGFWLFNRHPAKIFLGDVGSVPLGLVVGFLLLRVACNGQWAEALILPAYYMVDGSLTLCNRLLKGEKIWQAHSQHAYQVGVRRGNTHSEIVQQILALNLILISLAVLASQGGIYKIGALIVAYVMAFVLRWSFLHTSPIKILPPVVSN